VLQWEVFFHDVNQTNKTLIKKLIPAALLVGLATAAYAQSEILLDNLSNTDTTNSASTTNGLFWIKTNGSAPVLIHQDFNVAFYAGTNSTNLSGIGTFLLIDGSAATDNQFGSGLFFDPTGRGRVVPGASSSALFQVQVWLGNYTNYSSAVAAGAYAAQSAVFSNSVAAPPSTPPDCSAIRRSLWRI